MSRTKPNADLQSRSSRAKLPSRKAPYWMSLEKGRLLGYYKGLRGGNWIARFNDLKAETPTLQKALGAADDHSEPDGKMVLNFSQAQEAAREWFKEAFHQATGERVKTGAYTVQDALDAYVEDRKKAGAKTADRLAKDLARHIGPELGSVPLDKLTRKRLEDWKTSVASSPTRRAGREGKAPETEDEVRARRETTNRVWKNFKAALNLALRDKRVATDAGWRDLKPFKGTRVSRLRFLSVDEQRTLVQAAPSVDFQRLLQAGLFTGAREGELIALIARDFRAHERTLFIKPGKTNKHRHVHLSDEAVAFFQSCCAGLEPNAPIFPRTCYERQQKAPSGTWTRSELCRTMQATCDAAGLERLVFHELRHTAASTWINAGLNLYHVAAQLGHRDTRMVEEYYGHLDQAAKAEAMRRLTPTLGIYPLA